MRFVLREQIVPFIVGAVLATVTHHVVSLRTRRRQISQVHADLVQLRQEVQTLLNQSKLDPDELQVAQECYENLVEQYEQVVCSPRKSLWRRIFY